MVRMKLTAFLILALGVAATAAAVLWVALRDTPEAHAQQVAEACEKATASPYFDLVQTVAVKPFGGEVDTRAESKVYAAGADFHWTMQWDDGREHEGIYTAGVGYLRDGNAPWAVNKILDHEFVALHFGVDFTAEGWSLCRDFPDAEDKGWLQKVGEETVDGALTTLYTVSQDIDVPPLRTSTPSTSRCTFGWTGRGSLCKSKKCGLTRLTITGTLPGPSSQRRPRSSTWVSPTSSRRRLWVGAWV